MVRGLSRTARARATAQTDSYTAIVIRLIEAVRAKNKPAADSAQAGDQTVDSMLAIGLRQLEHALTCSATKLADGDSRLEAVAECRHVAAQLRIR
jgi:hypothetical protein